MVVFFTIGAMCVCSETSGQIAEGASSDSLLPPADAINIPYDSSALRIGEINLNFQQWEKEFSKELAVPGISFSEGEMTLGYLWGFPQDMNAARDNNSQFFTQGTLACHLGPVPVLFTGQYYQAPTRVGPQNFFRAEFDRRAFEEDKKKQIATRRALINTRRTNLLEDLQDLEMEHSFYTFTPPQLPEHTLPTAPSVAMSDLSVPQIPDKDLPSVPVYPDTSFSIPQFTADTLVEPRITMEMDCSQIDSVDYIADLPQQSVGRQMEETRDRLRSLHAYETQLQSADTRSLVKQGRLLQAMSVIRQLQLGQFTPSYSTFLLGRVPLNGINTALTGERGDLFLTHAQVVGEYNALIDRRQSGLQELTSDYLPSSRSIGDRVSCGMISTPSSRKNTLRLGFLYGIDKWMEDGNTSPLRLPGPAGRNAAAEVSGDVALTPGAKLSMAIATSTYKGIGVSEEGVQPSRTVARPAQAAAMACVSWNIKNRGLQINAGGRALGGQFRSVGNPYLREDMAEWQLAVKQKFGRKKDALIKGQWELGHRFKSNNLSGQLPVTHHVRIWNVASGATIAEKWMLSASCSPLHIQAMTQETTIITSDVGILSTGNITRIIQQRRSFHLISLVHSSYYLEGTKHSSGFNETGLHLDSKLPHGIEILAGVRRSVQHYADSAWNGTMVRYDAGIRKTFGKNIQAGIGARSIQETDGKYNWGARADMSWRFGSNFRASFVAERVALESYYDAELLRLYRENPFHCEISIQILLI